MTTDLELSADKVRLDEFAYHRVLGLYTNYHHDGTRYRVTKYEIDWGPKTGHICDHSRQRSGHIPRRCAKAVFGSLWADLRLILRINMKNHPRQ